MQEPAKLVHFPFVIKVEGGASDKMLVPQNMDMEFLGLGTHSFGVAESRAKHLKTGSFKITAVGLVKKIPGQGKGKQTLDRNTGPLTESDYSKTSEWYWLPF